MVLAGKKGNSSKGKDVVRIPIWPFAHIPYVVFLPMAPEEVPSAEDLLEIVLNYWEKNADPSVRDKGPIYIDNDFLVFGEPVEIKSNPIFHALSDMAAAFMLDKDQQARLKKARSALPVWSTDQIFEPREGSAFGIVCVQGLVVELKGLGLDASTARPFPLEARPETSNGVEPFWMAGEILFEPALDAKGKPQSVTTAGLEKYGFPEIEVRDIGGATQFDLTVVILAAAQAIWDMASDEAERYGQRAKEISVKSPLTINSDDAAYGLGPLERFDYEPDREAQVGLVYEPSTVPLPKGYEKGAVPLVLDADRLNYNGRIALTAPPGLEVPQGSHWVSEVAKKLGLKAK